MYRSENTHTRSAPCPYHHSPGSTHQMEFPNAVPLCILGRIEPQPPPSLPRGLQPAQWCLGVARVMSEQKVPRSVEQRIVIKLLVEENVQPFEILQRLKQQYGEECLSRTRVFEWCKCFREGRERVENEPHDRRPRTSPRQTLSVLMWLFVRKGASLSKNLHQCFPSVLVV